MSTPQNTDLIAVERNGITYKKAFIDMADILDTDLILVQRSGTSYKCTGADYKAAVVPPDVAPVIGSAVLSEDDTTGARFTSQSYTTTLTMNEAGVPNSSKYLKATIQGTHVGLPTTANVTSITDLPMWSDSNHYSWNSFTQGTPYTGGTSNYMGSSHPSGGGTCGSRRESRPANFFNGNESSSMLTFDNGGQNHLTVEQTINFDYENAGLYPGGVNSGIAAVNDLEVKMTVNAAGGSIRFKCNNDSSNQISSGLGNTGWMNATDCTSCLNGTPGELKSLNLRFAGDGQSWGSTLINYYIKINGYLYTNHMKVLTMADDTNFTTMSLGDQISMDITPTTGSRLTALADWVYEPAASSTISFNPTQYTEIVSGPGYTSKALTDADDVTALVESGFFGSVDVLWRHYCQMGTVNTSSYGINTPSSYQQRDTKIAANSSSTSGLNSWMVKMWAYDTSDVYVIWGPTSNATCLVHDNCTEEGTGSFGGGKVNYTKFKPLSTGEWSFKFNQQTFEIYGIGMDPCSDNLTNVYDSTTGEIPQPKSYAIQPTGYISGIDQANKKILVNYMQSSPDFTTSNPLRLNSEGLVSTPVTLYPVLSNAGSVSSLTSTDPGYVAQTSESVIQEMDFPAILPTGKTPDEDIPVGSTIVVNVKAENTSGSSFATSNTLTPT